MSTEPYVPSEGTVRKAYRNRRPGSAYFIGVEDKDPDAEFDRFIAKVKADAWAEGATAAFKDASREEPDPEWQNPYRTEGGL